jgi:hypothetical protein
MDAYVSFVAVPYTCNLFDLRSNNPESGSFSESDLPRH